MVNKKPPKEDFIGVKYLVALHCPTYVRRWTKQAIECYKRGCRCQGCFIFENYDFKCQMKKCVLELVRRFKRPNEDYTND